MSFDTGLLAKLIVDAIYPGKKETFENGFVAVSVFSVVLSVLIGVVALWLSWQCNTWMGYHWIIKAIYGAFAFLFGLTYIVLYILLRWDVCMVLRYKRGRR